MTTTVPAGYSVTSLVTGADYFAGWHTGSSVNFHCSGTSTNVSWYLNAIAPNCSNLTGPSQIVLGSSGAFRADFESSAGNLSGQIFYGAYNNIVTQSCPGNTCSISGNWTLIAARAIE